jgi:hypothetical protein
MPTVVYSSSLVYAHEFWSCERICNVSVGIVSNSMTGRQREDSSSYHSHGHGICGSCSIFPYYRTFLWLMSGKHAGHRPNYHWVGVLTVWFRCLHDFWSRQVQISANRTELSLRIWPIASKMCMRTIIALSINISLGISCNERLWLVNVHGWCNWELESYPNVYWSCDIG